MAQQFVLKGVKELRDYTSTDSTFTFKVKNDPRGGDTWQIPKWWDKKGNNTEYVSCTILDAVGTNYLLIIPTSMDTQLMVTYDDDVYNIKFSNFNAVDRIAITGKDTKKVVVEYLLPSISGGAVAKRIVQPAASIGEFTITGKGSVDVGQSTQYQSNATPDADDATYAWTVLSSGSVVPTGQAEVTAGATASGCTVSWKAAGTYAVRCVVSSETASDSPQSDDRAVTCSAVDTVGTVEVTGSATPQAQKTSTYTASVTGNNVNDLTYKWSVLNATAQIANPNASSTGITFDAQGNATVQCVVGSVSTDASGSDTLAVVVSTAKTLGTPEINGITAVSAPATNNYSVDLPDGNVADATYQWSVSPSGGVSIAAATAKATNITFNNANAYEVKCVVSSATATDSPQTATLDVTATASETIGTVVPAGPASVTQLNTGKNYTVSVNGGDATNLSYVWTSTPTVGCTINNHTTATPQMVFTAAGDYKLECQVSAEAATNSPQFGDIDVTVTDG